jgi:NADH dehydrogenase
MILVMGGTGFVGPKIVHALRAEDHPVRVTARKPEREDQLRTWGCEVVPGDMTDPESLRRAVEGCDTVVHLVAILLGSPEAFERVMVQGTRDLVRAAKEAGATRFVLMSALGTGEQTKSLTPYFRAKWEEEQAVKGSGIDHTIFRPSFIFGPGGGMLPALLRLVRYSPLTPVLGTKRLQPIWIDDVASFFVKSLSTPGAVNGTFELGGPDQVTWDELHAAIRRVLGKRRLAFRVPVGLAAAGARAVEILPPLRGARAGITMLEFGDNVTDIGPAVETFGIQPISLEEQLRRGARGA